jgi:hypothetical protein
MLMYNVLEMMRSIIGMPNRHNVIWFENVCIRLVPKGEFEAINIYDSDKNIIAVFKKSTGKFVTTCRLYSNE